MLLYYLSTYIIHIFISHIYICIYTLYIYICDHTHIVFATLFLKNILLSFDENVALELVTRSRLIVNGYEAQSNDYYQTYFSCKRLGEF